MSDVDSILSTDERDHDLMEKLKRPLFKASTRKRVSISDVSPLDGIAEQTPMYAITVNIQPTKRMNNKQWRNYTFGEQKAILSRIELSIRKKNPSINLKKFVFEECPKLHQIHFHAMYEHSEEWHSVLLSYLERVCGSPLGKQTTPWRAIDSQLIYDEQGWIDYCNKDQNKT